MTASCPIIVIGHVDHGKTALVRALTGMETDRLQEEKQRGLSITLGFAHRTTARGVLDVIDAPGHEDFLRTMVAGASGARAALLVVSAPDGPEAQTFEHVEIALRLGITRGVVALTKADLVALNDRPARHAAIAVALSAAGLTPDTLVFCSAKTGEGLEALGTALDDLIGDDLIGRPAPGSPPGGFFLPPAGFFLPIDRIFSVHGTGTVVTGTLQGGDLTLGGGAALNGGRDPVALRSLQVHGEDVALARAHQRVAVGLRGIAADGLARGDVLHRAGAYTGSERWHVWINLSDRAPRGLRHMDRVRIMLGTMSEVAEVRLLDGACLAAGQSGLAELRLTAPKVAHAGQRAILRALSPAQTLGGALIIDPAPPPLRRRDEAWRAVLLAAMEDDPSGLVPALAHHGRGLLSQDDAARLSRTPFEALRTKITPPLILLGETTWTRAEDMAVACTALEETLKDYFARHPLRLCAAPATVNTGLGRAVPLPLRALAEQHLIKAGLLERRRQGLALAGRDPLATAPPDMQAAFTSLEDAIRGSGLMPPDRPDLMITNADGGALLELLVDRDRVLALYNHALRRMIYLHTDVIAQAAAHLRTTFPPPHPFKTGEARAALNTNRKVIVPLLEHLDSAGVSVRDGDLRRMAEPPA